MGQTDGQTDGGITLFRNAPRAGHKYDSTENWTSVIKNTLKIIKNISTLMLQKWTGLVYGLMQVLNSKKSVRIFFQWEYGSFPFASTFIPTPPRFHFEVGVLFPFL